MKTQRSTQYFQISLEDALFFYSQGALFIDVRSPSEFQEDHFWDAKNIHLFDDEQRALVGTLFLQQSPQEATQKGAEIAKEKIRDIYFSYCSLLGKEGKLDYEKVFQHTLQNFLARNIQSQPIPRHKIPFSPKPVFIYCWRGGMRSLAITAFLRNLGEPVYQLQGGYKAFRRYVREELQKSQILPSMILIDGLTGVGKTKILEMIESLWPGHTLDLEGLAQHRSSILGALGKTPRSQKHFESLLLKRLLELKSPVFVEGESRKIGDIILPAPLFQAMYAGPKVLIQAPLELRAKRLAREYSCLETLPFLQTCLPYFQKHLAKQIFQDFQQAIQEKDLLRIAKILIEYYYDPRYKHGKKKNQTIYELKLEAMDLKSTAQKLIEYFQGL